MNICTAKCLAHYENLWTFELTYPRYIHSEFMTHRAFSRNASSSRAIPVAKVIKQVESNPVIPPKVYMNRPGMVGEVVANEAITKDFYNFWREAAENSCNTAKKMERLGIHKQHINRILEPFQFIKVIVTATEWFNFFKLRLAFDAQPEMQDLAKAIYEEMYNFKDKPFGYIKGEFEGESWLITVPYVTDNDLDILGDDCDNITLMQVSAARCARVSYNNHDGSKPDIKKDFELFDRLYTSGHMSPLEHTCLMDERYVHNANLIGWVSLRHILENGGLTASKVMTSTLRMC